MSATPTKDCKRGRKPKIDMQILSSKLFFWRRKSVIRKSIFAVGQRSVGLILADCCGSIGFALTRGQDADFLASYCNTDDISGKPSVQLKIFISLSEIVR